jgi:phospholipase/carboxylesterase
MMDTMPLQTIDIDAGPKPTAAIIILHGLGADGSDFLPFCEEVDLHAVGPMRYVLPSAPVIPVSLNGGYEMRAWYDILPTNDEARREDEAGLRHSQLVLNALIQREVGRGIPPERIVLMGFSQGCAMALMTGLRYPQRLAGIVALSGYLPLLDATEAERSVANAATPIFMAHGDRDDVVLMSRGERARDHLLSLRYDLVWHEYPMDHSLCMDEVRDINAWLLQVLQPPASAPAQTR